MGPVVLRTFDIVGLGVTVLLRQVIQVCSDFWNRTDIGLTGTVPKCWDRPRRDKMRGAGIQESNGYGTDQAKYVLVISY